MQIQKIRDHYDSVYTADDFFGHQTSLYRKFITALVRKIGIRRGSLILDVGCGQGYISYYLLCCGMNVFCTDISMVGLYSLGRFHTLFLGKRVLADILHPPFKQSADVVFSRSCSLLNTDFRVADGGCNFGRSTREFFGKSPDFRQFRPLEIRRPYIT